MRHQRFALCGPGRSCGVVDWCHAKRDSDKGFFPVRRRVIFLLRRIATASAGGIRLATALLLIYWVVIFAGTHVPRLPSHSSVQVGDKTMHVGAFAGLAFLLAWAAPKRWIAPHAVKYWAAAIALLYGVIDELTQSLVDGRTSSAHDLLADALGVAAGLTAYLCLRRWLFAGPRPASDGALPAGAER